MDQTHPTGTRVGSRRDEQLPSGVTAIAIALFVSSFALFLIPLFG